MGELVLVLLITWAFKHAWDHSRGDYRKSLDSHRKKQPAKQKRPAEVIHHDIGYWAHQGTHGFPAFRHGFGHGWHEARQKAARSRAERERAKADHLETAADLEPQVRDARTRQRGARARIRSLRGPRWPSLPDAGDDKDGTCRYCGAEPGQPCAPHCPYLNQDWREVDRINAERQAQAAGEGSPEVQPDRGPDSPGDRDDAALPTYSYGPASACAGWPAFTDADRAHHYARRMGTSNEPWVVTEYPPGGGPGTTIATYPAAGEQEPPGGKTEDEPSPETAGDGPATEGDQPVSAAADTTYDGVLQNMAATRNVAEGHAAEMQQASQRASQQADEMQALDVDKDTLSAMADHLDAHDTAVKAQQRVIETAEAVEATLKRGHQDLAEAHQNAPVVAAEKQFYAA